MHKLCTTTCGVGQNYVIRCIHGKFGREVTKCTVKYGVYIQFWLTLTMCTVISLLKTLCIHCACIHACPVSVSARDHGVCTGRLLSISFDVTLQTLASPARVSKAHEVRAMRECMAHEKSKPISQCHVRAVGSKHTQSAQISLITRAGGKAHDAWGCADTFFMCS